MHFVVFLSHWTHTWKRWTESYSSPHCALEPYHPKSSFHMHDLTDFSQQPHETDTMLPRTKKSIEIQISEVTCPRSHRKISDRLRLKPRSSYFKSRGLSTHHSCIGRWDIVFLTSILEYKVNGDWARKCGLFHCDKQDITMALLYSSVLHPLSPGLSDPLVWSP